MKRTDFLLLSGFLILPVFASPAQEQLSRPPQQPQSQVQTAARPSDGGTREMLISILIPSLPNAPFSATVNTEWIRVLADGSSITLKNHRAIARDAAGRIFQERRMLVPEDRQDESVVRQIEISNPIAHTLYICIPRERTCQLEAFSPRPFAAPPRVGTNSGKTDASGLEDMGTQSIGGLETVGTRETTVIPTGTIGNNSPLISRKEFWYSSLLGVNLISKRQDPRFGEQNFEVTDISLGEPDAKLFEVPSGFKVLDLRLRKATEPSSPESASSN